MTTTNPKTLAFDSTKMVTTKNPDPSIPTYKTKGKPNTKVAVNNFLKLTL